MGHLHYGGSESFALDDRLLTHLRTVILAKLHLEESLTLTWEEGDHRRSIWLHSSIPLHFEFGAEATADLNHQWVEYLLRQANSQAGVLDLEEPAAA
ncbi:DUF7882 family protein [Leucobacter sp. GX24907]